MRTIYKGNQSKHEWSVGDRFCHATLGFGEILELRNGYFIVKVYDVSTGQARVTTATFENITPISDDALHVHQWEWDTSEVHTFDDEVVNSIEGMFCACGDRLSVAQVRDIVNVLRRLQEHETAPHVLRRLPRLWPIYP